MEFQLDRTHQPRKLPDMLPRCEYVMQTRVITGKGMAMGSYGGTGQRIMVPIVGGDFDGPELKGRVVPGGTEWPLVRLDGVGTTMPTIGDSGWAPISESRLSVNCWSGPWGEPLPRFGSWCSFPHRPWPCDPVPFGKSFAGL